jgi:hypothetical protein
MKTLFAILAAALLALPVAAQVRVELSQEQEQFLPSESVPLKVKITNRSGQTMHLGAEPDWLTFSVEAADGFVVIKNAEVPVTGEFDLDSAQEATKTVDLQPYFAMTKPGRYRVTATLRIKDWSSHVTSEPKSFDVIHGALLWEQDYGVPTEPGHPPEARKYSLQQANYLKEQLRLYVQVGDVSSSRVYKVTALGPLVSFSHPEAQVDKESQLHVLWQSGAQSFSYSKIYPNGVLAESEIYDNFNSRPRLAVTDDGEVVVKGGTRRMKTTEYPVVKMPDELPNGVKATNAPTAKKK